MALLKLVGAMLLVLATTLVGFKMAGAYRDRTRQLRALIRAVTHLQAQVEYQTTPLPSALQHVAARCSPPCGVMFQRAGERLAAENEGVSEAFRSALSWLQAESALKAGDCELVQMLAETLATTDRAHLDTQFQFTIDHLRQAEEDAREQGMKNARLWQYLGVLSGVLLVILLY
ncbi:stage III sporulation protein SpoIIIAB [Alicyclobacillus fodiniaquatilis]|uniref:Stage III sporulation protein SpoIIIAB n=1 Tax=Alicyclobacillus fodiniaquatilis TaxID=1661150 RepID=A0ABW4JHZ6_9BACL